MGHHHHGHTRRDFFRHCFGGVLAGATVFEEAFLRAGWARAQAQTGNTVPDERPATTTVMGDTGLWFVPTGEVLKDKN